MTSRWKRIATRAVQTYAQCEAVKRYSPTTGQAAVIKGALVAPPGIPAHGSHAAGQVASMAVVGLVMRSLKGGGT